MKLADKALQLSWNKEREESVRDPGYCRIVVLGVGGAGNNTVNRLMEMQIAGVECIAINTDIQHLDSVQASHKVLIGEKITRGLGAGGDPKIGRSAIEESKEKVLISEFLIKSGSLNKMLKE